jgi:alpha-tubulin suppressor-like RCC1 family protein
LLNSESDELFVWGDNRFGKLFSSLPGKKILRPERVQSGLAITSVSFGPNHSLCLDAAYNVYTAGLSNIFQYSSVVEVQGEKDGQAGKSQGESLGGKIDQLAQAVRKLELFDDKIVAVQTGHDFSMFLSCKLS